MDEQDEEIARGQLDALMQRRDRSWLHDQDPRNHYPPELLSVFYVREGQETAGPNLAPSKGGMFFAEMRRIEIYQPPEFPHKYVKGYVGAEDTTTPKYDLVAFAHELGHFDVSREGIGYGKPDPDRPLMHYAEEAAAWYRAEDILREVRFIDWRYFDAQSETALAGYRKDLRVDDHVASEISRLVREDIHLDEVVEAVQNAT